MVIENNEYYNWTEPKLIVQLTPSDKRSYILYNKISDFKRNNIPYKLVHIDVMNDTSSYITYKRNYRKNYITYLNNIFPDHCKSTSGYNAMIDAIKSCKENLILLFKNYTLVGALSYDIHDKKKLIIISHIGVVNKRRGYGTILMNELFNIADTLNYKTEVTSNGYADPFYEHFPMVCIIVKPLRIYSRPPVNDK